MDSMANNSVAKIADLHAKFNKDRRAALDAAMACGELLLAEQRRIYGMPSNLVPSWETYAQAAWPQISKSRRNQYMLFRRKRAVYETLHGDDAWNLWQACSGNRPRAKSPAELDLARQHQERVAVAVHDADRDTLVRLINAYLDEHPQFLDFVANKLEVEKD